MHCTIKSDKKNYDETFVTALISEIKIQDLELENVKDKKCHTDFQILTLMLTGVDWNYYMYNMLSFFVDCF